MPAARDPRKIAAAVELDPLELTVILLEIGIKLNRPKGKTAAQIMEAINGQVARGEIPAYIVADFQAMAHASIMYLRDRINALERVS
jgi:hypothetical protein